MAKDNNPVLKSAGLVKSLMRNKLLMVLFMLVSGLIFVTTTNGTDMAGIARLVMGVVIAVSLIGVVANIVAKDKSASNIVLIVLYALALILGIVLFVRVDLAALILRVFFGILTIISGLANSLETARFHEKKNWKFYICIGAAVLQIVLGVVMIVASVDFSSLVKRIAGGAMVFSALVNILVYFQMKDVRK